jgi:hypothetical protein
MPVSKEQYRPELTVEDRLEMDELLTLDLSKAVLPPSPRSSSSSAEQQAQTSTADAVGEPLDSSIEVEQSTHEDGTPPPKK